MARIIRRLAKKGVTPSTPSAKSKRTIGSRRKVATNKTTAAPTGGFDRGSSGFAKARDKREKQEEDYQKRKNTPFSFWLKPGSDAEVILLDKGEPFFVSLHKVKNARGRWEDEVCIADTGQGPCPLCESTGKEGSYTMVLTALDRRPYKVQSGPNAGKVVKVSKKLLYVKGRNLPKFERQYKGNAKENFRGVKLLCARGGDKESAMGEDLEFQGRVKESFLEKFKENAEPANYEEIFAIPTAAELRARYKTGDKGEVAGAGEFDEEDGYDSDSVGWGK